MRLDFNILWVDDQRARVESTRETVDLMVRQEGFRLCVEFAASVEEATRYLSEDIFGDHIDLVLMDYDLGAGAWGDEGLVQVRDRFEYKDVIFYSSEADNLRELVADKRLQGIFCSSRDDLPETVKGVFHALMKKVLDIDHSRGIVMGATSDIDHYVFDCIKAAVEAGGEDRLHLALKTVQKHLGEKSESFLRDTGKIGGIENLAELSKYPHMYTSSDRLRLLRTILKATGKHQDEVATIHHYLNNTVPLRNALAHVRVQTEGFSRRLFNSENEELTAEQMKELRQRLLGFQETVENLAAAIVPKPSA